MIKIQQYRKNRFRLIVRWEGKRHFIYSLSEGKPLMDHGIAWVAKEYVENEIEAGTFNPLEWRGHRSFDFERATKIWLENSSCSIEWLANRKRIVERFLIPFFRNWDIRKIGTVDLYRFLNFVKSKGNYKDKTIKNILDELRVFLNFHKESIPKVPVFPKIKFQTPSIRWIDETDQNRIFEFIPEGHKPIFIFMRYTACRPGEAGGLLKSNVFLKGDNPCLILATCLGKNQRIKPTTKTKIAKPLPIIPELIEIFKPRDLSPLVFTHKTRAGLVPYRRQFLEGIWNEANRMANEKYGTPLISLYNGLRHSFGCQRLNQGFSIEEIKEVMGHVDSRTTERYAKFVTQKLTNVMRGKIADLSARRVQEKT